MDKNLENRKNHSVLGKKVCHITSVHPVWDARIFHKECKTLANAGFEVCLIVVGQESKFEDGVQVINACKGFRSRLMRIHKAPKEILKTIQQMKGVMVCHLHDPELLTIAKKLKKMGIRVIYDAHEDVPRQILGKNYLLSFLRKPLSKLVEWYENKIVSQLDGVITPTPHIQNRFLQINPVTSLVRNTPLLEGLPDLKTENLQRKREICYVGKITKARGAIEMVKSLGYLKDVKLNLVGPVKDSLLKEMKELPEWKMVNFLGFQDRKGMNEVFQRSSIGLVVLHPLINFVEALPVKMFEYMAAKLPVVASDFKLWEEIISGNECGICVNPLNPKSIASKISYLINNKEVAMEMGENGRRAIEKEWNWKVDGKELIHVYNRLTHGK